MKFTTPNLCFGLLLCMLFVCIWLVPFNKVEESFNTQAAHDFLFLKTQFSKYDHVTFPGVVERTFLGSLALSIMASPILLLLQFFQVPLFYQKWIMLHTIRMILAIFIGYSHWRIAQSLPKQPRSLSSRYLLLTSLQFYSVFWTTRLLPNTFALVFSNLALASFLQHLQSSNGFMHWKHLATYLTIAVAIFRSELLLFSGCIFLQEFLLGRIPFFRSFYPIFKVLPILLLLTIGIDSFLWQKWIYPELQVFLFNTWFNQSYRWGTAPFHAYLTTHLPKLLSGGMLFIPLGLKNRASWSIFIPAFFFVVLYSFLPHKEARFIAYVIPYFNCITVLGWHRLPSWLRRLALLGTLIMTSVSVYVSMQNYPGGQLMHTLTPTWLPSSSIKIHIDDFTAQTGANLFLEHPMFQFSKLERLSDHEYHQFDARLVEWNTILKGPWKEAYCVECYRGRLPVFKWKTFHFFHYAPCVCLVPQTFQIDTYPKTLLQKWIRINNTMTRAEIN